MYRKINKELTCFTPGVVGVVYVRRFGVRNLIRLWMNRVGILNRETVTQRCALRLWWIHFILPIRNW